MLSTLIERCTWCSFFLSLVLLVSNNWYDDFYNTLDKNPSPFRLLQIWVQADRPTAQLAPIGGSLEDSKSWAQGIEIFLARAAINIKHDVTFEFVVDSQTSLANKNLLSHWTEAYPKNFKLVLLEDLLQELPHQEFLSLQCTCGVAASCSDFLRIFLLHKEGVTNTYLDIDTFLYRLQHQKRLFANFDSFATNSAQAFGLLQGQRGVFLGMQKNFESEPSSIQINNDCLVSKPQTSVWPLIKAATSLQIAKYQSYFELLNHRCHIVDYKSYQNNLNQRLEWAIKNPEWNVNQSPLVIAVAGPEFWRYFFDTQVATGYLLPYLPSSGGWMGPDGSIEGSAPYGLLQSLFGPKDAESVLKIALLSLDLMYYNKRDVSFALEIKKELLQLWEAFPESQKEIAIKVLAAPIKKTQELANEVV